jgi:hypothetical protein
MLKNEQAKEILHISKENVQKSQENKAIEQASKEKDTAAVD